MMGAPSTSGHPTLSHDSADNRGLSVGVEEEFFLHDPATGRLLPESGDVVAAARRLGGDLDVELMSTQVETKTAVCWSARELRAQLMAARSTASAAAREAGAQLVASGVSIGNGDVQAITDTQRYRRMADRFGLLVRRYETCGCHVHVGVPDRETAVQVCNHLRPWLPALLALTANSAVHQGRDTGHASWRSILNSSWPCSGPPPYFTSAEHYDSTVAMMIESGVILDQGMVYWDVRPSHHLPTIEVRIGDVPSTVDDAVLLATLVRALVGTAVRAIQKGDVARPVPHEALRAASWCAAHEGLSGRLLDPVSFQPSSPRRVFEMVTLHLDDELEELAERQRVDELLNRVLIEGNGAMWQRRALARYTSITDMLAGAAKRTVRE